jgi:hypothetical protein
MFKNNSGQTPGQAESTIINDKLNNIMRILTMLEKLLNRLLRRNYYNPNQYPPIVQEIEEALNNLRSWIQGYKNFACLPGFILIVGLAIKDLGDMIEQLMAVCEPLAGKKRIKKSKKFESRLNFANRLSLC